MSEDSYIDETSPEILESYLSSSDPELARQAMLCILDYEISVTQDMADSAHLWLDHKDRSIFTAALQVILTFNKESWSDLRAKMSPDRRNIGDYLYTKRGNNAP